MRKATYLLLIAIAFSKCQVNRSNEVFKDVFADLVITSSVYPLNKMQPPYVSRDTSKNKEIIMLHEKLYRMFLDVKNLQKFISSTHKITILNKLLPTSIKYFQYPDNAYASSLYDTTWIGNVDEQIKKQHKVLGFNKSDFKVPNYEISFIDNIPKASIKFDYAAQHDDVLVVQLSNVVFNKDKMRGLFYFSISEIDNSSGYMKFCYVEKINSKWVIKKIE